MGPQDPPRHSIHRSHEDLLGVNHIGVRDRGRLRLAHLPRRARADAAALRRLATARNMKLLRQDGAAKIAAGITSAEEVLRVTQEE